MHVHRIRTLKKLVSVHENVNSLVFEFGYRFGHYCQTSSWYYEKLSPQHIVLALVECEFKDHQYSWLLCVT